jgi:glutaminyl-tRNA synthetase
VGQAPNDVKVWGVIHWVPAAHAVPAEVRLYDRLFTAARPEDTDGDIKDNLNPDSLRVVANAMLEPSLAHAEPGSRWQLERVGYFIVDAEDSRPASPVLNRIDTARLVAGWPKGTANGRDPKVAGPDHDPPHQEEPPGVPGRRPPP